MGKTALAFSLVLSILTFPPPQESVVEPAPLPPQTGAADETPTFPIAQTKPEAKYPARVIIPDIKLDSAIQNMGIDSEGRMDVPSEKTRYVGWYERGTVPGEPGSAVFDAHVTAAFKKLKKLDLGDHVYVVSSEGKELDFKIEEMTVYPLEEVPSDKLFNRSDGKWLNLITCAGKRIKGNEFTHRLVVYARLVE